MKMTLANPVPIFLYSLVLLLFGLAIGIHWSKSPDIAVWIALSGALLMVIHDLLEGFVWFGVTAKWTQAVRQSILGKRPNMEPEKYVRTLLEEMERLKPGFECGPSHAIALD